MDGFFHVLDHSLWLGSLLSMLLLVGAVLLQVFARVAPAVREQVFASQFKAGCAPCGQQPAFYLQ